MSKKKQFTAREIADVLVREGTSQTTTGRWSVGFEEIQNRFGLDLSADSDAGRLIVIALKQEEEINELIMTEDHIEMSYHLEYCPACNQGGAPGIMNLFSLMGCNLYDVHLCHDEEEHQIATIAELNQDTLTEEGKAEWADVLESRVTKIYPGVYGLQVSLTGCMAQRLADFSFMLAGYCSEEDYERWVTDEDRSYAWDGEQPEESSQPIRTVNLIATYEEIFQVPQEDRLTVYFPNYGCHCFRSGVADSQIRPVYEKALAVIEMTDHAYQDEGNAYHQRGEVISRMRDCLLAKEVQLGEEVLFINTEPYAGPGDFSFRGGIVKAVDPGEKTCTIRGQFFDMEDVPLHYILGRYNPDVKGKHYGKEDVEVLFGENEAMAQHDLKEAEERWNALNCEDESQEPVMQ